MFRRYRVTSQKKRHESEPRDSKAAIAETAGCLVVGMAVGIEDAARQYMQGSAKK